MPEIVDGKKNAVLSTFTQYFEYDLDPVIGETADHFEVVFGSNYTVTEKTTTAGIPYIEVAEIPDPE